MIQLRRIFCFWVLILGLSLGVLGVRAQEDVKPECPGPTEGRVGGTDSGFKFFNPNTQEVWNSPTVEGIVLCPMSPNFTSCRDETNAWEYHAMDGASPVFKGPISHAGGNFTLTCTADTGVVYTIAVGATIPADTYHRAYGGCEEATAACGAVAAGAEAGAAKDDLSRITDHSGGGGVVLRDGDRDGEEAKLLTDLRLNFLMELEGDAAAAEAAAAAAAAAGTEAAETTMATIHHVVEITFKGDTEVDLSFDYDQMVITATDGVDIDDDVFGNYDPDAPAVEGEDPALATISNVVRGRSKLLFDVEADSLSDFELVITGLGVYITDGHAKDSEQLMITFNELEYFGDNFFIDTFSEYCDGIGRFSGSTGLNGTFKIGDKLTYIPLADNRGQDYFLDLRELDLPGLMALGDEVTIPAGSIDKIDMTFPLIEERRSTGEYLYTCTTSPISVDNELSDFGEEVGSFTGSTGANGIYRLGDKLVYHGPYPEDEDTYTVNLESLGKTAKEPGETEIEIEKIVEVDDDAMVFMVTATDNAGNEVTFDSSSISVDTIRPTFSEEFLAAGEFIEFFIPQEKLDDPRYTGFADKFSIEKTIWGDGDHVKVLLPEDDGTDEGDPLVTLDFSDVSTAGNLEFTNNVTDLEMELDRYYDGVYTDVLEVAGYIDQVDYTKRIRFMDDAGNEPVDAEGNVREFMTKATAIDMVAPQIPLGPPSYSLFEIMVNKLIAIIGDAIKLTVPLQDSRSEEIRFSSNLSNVGGTAAEFLFEQGEKIFTIEAGEIQAGDDYDRVIYYFDKAFNLVEREIDRVLIDNRVSTFDTSCGATFVVVDKNNSGGDFNLIADVTNDEADGVIFAAPNNTIDGCDLDTFSIDFTPISSKKDLVDSYSKIPADGRIINIDVGNGTLDDLEKQLVLKAHDQYGNTKDYLTGLLRIDNELTTRQMLTDSTKFADFDTVEDTLYVGLGDRIDIELKIAEMEDIVSVNVRVDGGIKEYALTQGTESDGNVWKGLTTVTAGEFLVEPKYLIFVITDDAGNVVELEGNQKIYISNKIPTLSNGDGGTSDLYRDGFSSGIPLRGKGDFLREKEEFDKAKIASYMSEAEKYEKKIQFLKDHGFELGPDELGYLKARSLNRRLNYLEPTVNVNLDRAAPSYWELMKDKFKTSRKKVITNQKEPRALEKKLRKQIDPTKEVKNWDKLADREGGLHTQRTLANLKRSAQKDKPKFSRPGTLRKSEMTQRGRVGSIR